MHAVGGEDMEWGLKEHLLAAMVDVLNGANWQRAGNDKAPRPKPVPRPGVKDETKRQFGKGSFTIAEVEERLARVRRG